MEYLAKSTSEMKNVAKEVLEIIVAGKSEEVATVLVCSGNLGAGKTTFAQALASHMGIKKQITSPTFVIQKIYKLSLSAKKKLGFSHFIHIDAYRLDDEKELETLRFKEIALDPNNLVLIEWGERVKKILPASYKTIHFVFIDENIRQISFKNL